MVHVIDSRLHHAVLDAFEATFGKRPSDAQIQLQTTRAEFEGDRTVVVFPLAGMAGAPPHVAAEKLGEALLARCDWIVAYGVVKGFLNLTNFNIIHITPNCSPKPYTSVFSYLDISNDRCIL